MLVNNFNRKLELEYPCAWTYKLIGSDQDLIRKAIQEIMRERECKVSFSNSSRTGKYHCLNLEITVSSEEDRTLNYQAFENHPHIKKVL